MRWERAMLKLVLALSVAAGALGLTARGESLAAFDGRCIPPGCVAPRSNTPGILGRRALPAGRLARLGATPDFHHGLSAAAAPLAADVTHSAGSGQAERPRVTFLRDVAPILNKVGCTAGACHGAAKGKNGFQLSMRGYDPQFDYESLLYDMAGRRFNRADPGRSLMLAKTSQEDAHGGGRRFAKDSDYYKT